MRHTFSVAQKFLVTIALIVSVSPVAWAQTGPVFQFTQKAGPYAVGLKVVEQYDYSRTYRRATDGLGAPYQGERARPLQTLIWYPAKAGGGGPMTVLDYWNLWATETSFDKPRVPARAREWRTAMAPSLEMRLWAVRDAVAESGRFPVVIYAPSFSSYSWENADLCEYLASYGYVVIASPNMGSSTREMTEDLDGVNAQARDISFLIGYAVTLPNTDTSQVAAAGFSWGGISNLFAAARDNRIDALVALDGSLRYHSGLVEQAGDVHPALMTIPLIYFAQSDFTLEDQARYISPAYGRGPNVMNAWTRGDLIRARMLGLTHRGHSSMFQRDEDMWKFSFPEGNAYNAGYRREDGMVGYGWMARYTLQFLNAYLKQDKTAMEFLKKSPAQNGVPAHVVAVSYRAASGPPASFDAFRARVGLAGFAHAADVYEAIRREKSDFNVAEGVWTDWTQELIDDGRLREALALLELTIRLYPGSSTAYTQLANVHRQLGKRSLAIDAYRKALERSPLNTHARKQLIELEEGAPRQK